MTITESSDEAIAELAAALRFGAGCAIDDQGVREWAPGSPIGVMLRALGCNSLTLDAAARKALGL